MNPWSNIEVPSDDPEIVEINKIESSINEIPLKARKVRELITGFEVCHFKYKQHLENIKSSILSLKPNIELREIGSHHIRHGTDAWQQDTTGRSLMGQQYIHALNVWLGEDREAPDVTISDPEHDQKVSEQLGIHIKEKERLVRLLKARLLWDWESYEKHLTNREEDLLESQVCRMDICHYSFPVNMYVMIQAIGQMKPIDKFEGCGSYNPEIRDHIREVVSELYRLSESLRSNTRSHKKNIIKYWLVSCLIKTLKEQAKL